MRKKRKKKALMIKRMRSVVTETIKKRMVGIQIKEKSEVSLRMTSRS